jgi:hypothetical protein
MKYYMNLYDAMLKRKSIRKYADKKVNKKVLTEIQNCITTLKPLYDSISMKMIVLDDSKLGEYFEGNSLIHAPHYIVITSQNKPFFGENVGFMGESLILFLTYLKPGSCWIGTLNLKKQYLNCQTRFQLRLVMLTMNYTVKVYIKLKNLYYFLINKNYFFTFSKSFINLSATGFISFTPAKNGKY